MDLFEPHETNQVLKAFSTEIVRSYRSFEKFFSEANRLQAITYCESPKVLPTFEVRSTLPIRAIMRNEHTLHSTLSSMPDTGENSPENDGQNQAGLSQKDGEESGALSPELRDRAGKSMVSAVPEMTRSG